MYYYDHASKKEGYAGVSAIPLKVIESRKEFDWSVNKPVEFRPYIKNIAGRKRMFFLSTISAIRAGSSKFDGSATPDLALIDSEYRDVVWIDAKHPEQWDRNVYNQLNEAWRASENIGEYYKEEATEPIDNIILKIKDTESIIDSIVIIEKIDSVKINEIKKLQKKIDSIKRVQ